ncbi:hypothetical protein BSK60_06315 [Paenibacillus odorifer]|nr:hypothetical protein BSK60_06315 [Paenibacillus odorifer]
MYATTKGKEHTVDLFGKGDFFGDLEVIHPSNIRVLSAVAMNDTVLFDIQHQQITVLDPVYLLEYTDFD